MTLDPLADGISKLELLDVLGGDLANVNGARASFAMRKREFDAKDEKLLRRLGADSHHTPLRHTYFQLYVEAPEFVARQWYKHIVGCEYAFKDLPWSEFSQRYKEVEGKSYMPAHLRGQSVVNKQTSEPLATLDTPEHVDEFGHDIDKAFGLYHKWLGRGMAREQARLVLPMATYTSWVWTASIQAVVHFCRLRDHGGAQWEIQQYAKALRALCRPYARHTWAALSK